MRTRIAALGLVAVIALMGCGDSGSPATSPADAAGQGARDYECAAAREAGELDTLRNQRAALVAEGQESGQTDTARYRNLLQELDEQIAALEACE